MISSLIFKIKNTSTIHNLKKYKNNWNNLKIIIILNSYMWFPRDQFEPTSGPRLHSWCSVHFELLLWSWWALPECSFVTWWALPNMDYDVDFVSRELFRSVRLRLGKLFPPCEVGSQGLLEWAFEPGSSPQWQRSWRSGSLGETKRNIKLNPPNYSNCFGSVRFYYSVCIWFLFFFFSRGYIFTNENKKKLRTHLANKSNLQNNS